MFVNFFKYINKEIVFWFKHIKSKTFHDLKKVSTNKFRQKTINLNRCFCYVVDKSIKKQMKLIN